MKTAISIPDQIFSGAEDMANKLGISRSELYTKAIKDYLKKHDPDVVTQELNALYANEGSSLNKELKKMQLTSLTKSHGSDEW